MEGNSQDLWDWVEDVKLYGPTAKCDVGVTLRDEPGQDVQFWKLRGVTPLKYIGPTLAAKGGGDVAMEELTVSIEGLELATV